MFTTIYEGNIALTLDELIDRITKPGTLWSIDEMSFNPGLTVSCFNSKVVIEDESLYFYRDRCKDCKHADGLPLVGIFDYRVAIEHAEINELDDIIVLLSDGSVLSMVQV